MTDRIIGYTALDGGLVDRRRQDRDLTEKRQREEGQRYIPCPGGCGGSARLEPPLTLYRNGVSKVVQEAVCLEQCRETVIVTKPGGKKVELERKKRFETVIKEEAMNVRSPEKIQRENSVRERVLAYKTDNELRWNDVAEELSLHIPTVTATYLSGWARGANTVSEERLDIIERWLDGDPPKPPRRLGEVPEDERPKTQSVLDDSVASTIVQEILAGAVLAKLEELNPQLAGKVEVGPIQLSWSKR